MKLFFVAVTGLLFFDVITARPPNIVLFYADDLGYGDLSSYGHPSIITPNIDSLATNGTKFTQFYSPYPICTPARSGLMTGRLPVRNGIYTAHDYPLDRISRVFLPISTGGLPADEVTIPQVLKKANYTSALIGKWHIGHHNCLPTQRGFDEFYGLPYPQDEGCPPRCQLDTRDWHGVPLYNGTDIIEQPVNLATLTPRYNAKALDFVNRNKDNSFFLFMSYDEVHVPLFASKTFLNSSCRGLYGDAAREMDNSIGVIMNKLRELSLLEDTLVIFSSDNGAWTNEKLNGGSNGLLKGQKGETWEGGMRVPTIASWMGKIPAGKVSMALGSQLDFIATFAELAGVSLESMVANKTMDGQSLVSVLTQEKQSPRETVFFYRAHTLMAVRYKEYKAHFVTRSGWGDDPPERHNPPILYNLEQDPSELYPLDHNAYEDVIDKIKAIYEDQMKSVTPLPPSQLDPIDLTGKVAPCCDHDTKCVCESKPSATNLYQTMV